MAAALSLIGAQVGAKLVPRVLTWLIRAIFGIVFPYVSLKFVLEIFGVRI